MPLAGHQLEIHYRHTRRCQLAGKFDAVLVRNGAVGIPVADPERRIIRRSIGAGHSQSGLVGNRKGFFAAKERRYRAVIVGKLAGKVRRTEPVGHSLNLVRVFRPAAVTAHIRHLHRIAVVQGDQLARLHISGSAQKRGQVPSRRGAPHPDPAGVDEVLGRMSPQEADAQLHILDLRREWRFRGQAVAQGNADIASF
ncbi:hypothetical protein D3C76_1261830 [compost metagenome]